MSIFDGKRLSNETFKLDVDRMRRGWYSDKYFVNIAQMLTELAASGYCYQGQHANLPPGLSPEKIACGDIEVEMQWFTRRVGTSIVVGVDKALSMLRHCTGYFDGDTFVETSDKLEVWAVQDGSTVHSDGNPLNIQPVIRVRGRYRDFALLETSTLGILARSSRVATNVYDALVSARGKPLLFFPARFDVHEVQAADGYAYHLAVQRFNMDFANKLGPFISTDAQGDWVGRRWRRHRSPCSHCLLPGRYCRSHAGFFKSAARANTAHCPGGLQQRQHQRIPAGMQIHVRPLSRTAGSWQRGRSTTL